MFIPAATARKNLVYRIIPTPGQAFHGSVTFTTFFSIFLLFFLPSFSSPHVVLRGEQRRVLRNRFWFLIIFWERGGGGGEPVLMKNVTAHNCRRWPAAAVMMSPQWAGAPSCASRDKTTAAGGTAGTAPLWEMTLPCSNSFGLAPVGKPRASWRAPAAKWDPPAEWPSGQTRMNLGPSHPSTQRAA